MYSGEDDILELNSEENVQSQETIDQIEAEFLTKLQSLRVNCNELQVTLKAALITSGVCKKYTNARKTPLSQLKTKQNTDTDIYMYSSSALNLGLQNKDSFHLIQKFSETSLNKTVYKLPTQSSKPFTKTKFPSAARLLTTLRAEKRQRQHRKFLQRKKNSSLRPHLVSLRLIHGNSKDLFPKNSTTTSNLCFRRQKPLPWVPKLTIPKPFVFTLREAKAPIRATYAKKFLEEMLDEKARKEKAEYRKQFRAKPPPRTTYISDSSYIVQQISKRRTKSAPPGLKLKALSKPFLRSAPQLDERTFKANPVPITTYIRPSNFGAELRAAAKIQRGIEILLTSRAPFSIADHAMRTHVQNKVRHHYRCHCPAPSFTPSITKSVPDFRMLHMELLNKIAETRERRLPTMTVPFKFHQDTVVRHSCSNMSKHSARMNEKIISVRSSKSSDTYSIQ